MVEELAAQCAAAGFDLIAPLRIGWYNDAVSAPYDLPDFGSPASLAIVIGNTRALWPTLLAALDPENLADDPIDDYAATTIGAAVRSVGVPHQLRFGPEPIPRRVAMQRLAHVAGLAFQSASHLSVHPTYGPWIGLRAAVVLNVRAPDLHRPRLETPCDCAAHCAAAAIEAAALERALAEGHPDRRWRAWLAVRDACPTGRDHRYSEEQIRYHYTKDRSALLEAIADRTA